MKWCFCCHKIENISVRLFESARIKLSCVPHYALSKWKGTACPSQDMMTYWMQHTKAFLSAFGNVGDQVFAAFVTNGSLDTNF